MFCYKSFSFLLAISGKWILNPSQREIEKQRGQIPTVCICDKLCLVSFTGFISKQRSRVMLSWSFLISSRRVPINCKNQAHFNHLIMICFRRCYLSLHCSGGSRGGARGSAPPLFWVKKKKMTEGKKASRAHKSRPPSPLNPL